MNKRTRIEFTEYSTKGEKKNMIHMWLHRMDYFVVVISLTHTPADA